MIQSHFDIFEGDEIVIDVYGLRPVNRTAALVVSQAGCSSGELTDEQMRENLVIQQKKLASDILTLPKKSKLRKELGKKKSKVEHLINEITPKKKANGVEFFFYAVVKEELTAAHFRILMDRAHKRMNDAQQLTYNTT